MRRCARAAVSVMAVNWRRATAGRRARCSAAGAPGSRSAPGAPAPPRRRDRVRAIVVTPSRRVPRAEAARSACRRGSRTSRASVVVDAANTASFPRSSAALRRPLGHEPVNLSKIRSISSGVLPSRSRHHEADAFEIASRSPRSELPGRRAYHLREHGAVVAQSGSALAVVAPRAAEVARRFRGRGRPPVEIRQLGRRGHANTPGPRAGADERVTSRSCCRPRRRRAPSRDAEPLHERLRAVVAAGRDPLPSRTVARSWGGRREEERHDAARRAGARSAGPAPCGAPRRLGEERPRARRSRRAHGRSSPPPRRGRPRRRCRGPARTCTGARCSGLLEGDREDHVAAACQGGMASRCSRSPSTPMPVGPYILWR